MFIVFSPVFKYVSFGTKFSIPTIFSTTGCLPFFISNLFSLFIFGLTYPFCEAVPVFKYVSFGTKFSIPTIFSTTGCLPFFISNLFSLFIFGLTYPFCEAVSASDAYTSTFATICATSCILFIFL